MAMTTINITKDEQHLPYMLGNSGQTIFDSVGSIIKGTVSGVGKDAGIMIGSRNFKVAEDVLAGRKIGDEMNFMVESTDGKSVTLKAMQEYVGISESDGIGETLKSIQQVNVQRSTEQFVNILSESDLSVDVAASVEDDANAASRLSADDLKMLRQLGIDVTGSDLSHLMGLVNQYHAQQEGRTFKTGSIEVMKAIAQAQSMGGISDGAVKYMISNQMEFTYDNIYKAEYSASMDRPAKELSDKEWEQLRPQVDKMLEQQAVEVNQDTEAISKWMIEHNLEISKRNIELYQDITWFNNNGLDKEQYEKNVEDTLTLGRASGNAKMSGPSELEQVQQVIDTLNKITNDSVDKVVESGEKFNVRNLSAAQKSIDIYWTEQGSEVEAYVSYHQNIYETKVSYNDSSRENQENNRSNEEYYIRLQEIRLRLTLQSGYVMIRNGFDLETDDIREILDEMNHLEEREITDLFRDSRVAVTDSSLSIYETTMVVTNTIPYLPAATLGVVDKSGGNTTLNAVYQTGMLMASRMRQNTVVQQGAQLHQGDSGHRNFSDTYEALMTRPRADMGDSIKDAFANMDSMLEEMGIDKTEENRKAVRILSYNQMDITRESISRISTLDAYLKSILKDMTPENVLGMIRDGINPLNMDLESLRNELDWQNEKNGTGAQEKYSEFLCKLDKHGDITAEERKSYIGIYRLLHAVTSNSGRDLGAVVKSEQDITLNNLLTAHRSRRHSGREVVIDDDNGFLTRAVNQKESITEQILSAFPKKHMDRVLSIEQESVDEEDLVRLDGENLKKLDNVKEQDVRMLSKLELPFTPEYLQAANELIWQGGDIFQEIKRKLESRGNNEQQAFDELEQKIYDYLDNLDEEAENNVSKEMAADGVENIERNADEENPFWMADAFSVAFHQSEGNTFSARDLLASRQVHTMMRVANAMRQQENYLIPITVDDKVLTMNVMFVKDDDNAPGFMADVETNKYGNIRVDFKEGNDGWNMHISCASLEGKQVVTERIGEYCDYLVNHGIVANQVEVSQEKHTNVRQEYIEGHKESVSSRKLYEAAKGLVSFIRKI